MKIPVKFKIPYLWGDSEFAREEWGSINFLVGPNGSGKSKFIEELRIRLPQGAAGLKLRYLSTDRLMGFDRYSSAWGYGRPNMQGLDIGQFTQTIQESKSSGFSTEAFIILRQKLDIRVRVEAFLSTMFGRRVRLSEQGGFLRPIMQMVSGGTEYPMRENECHGLKELVSLLAIMYDDSYNCFLIDEPELHLHPQFQGFLISEMRRLAAHHPDGEIGKHFFLVTHSPYVLDFRSVEDLSCCLVFRRGRLPAWVTPTEDFDTGFLKRLLPRMNTHHKQLFFASRPIFVEGYTDQQLFALIQDVRGKPLGATGACFIDVGGKDEQEFYFRLSSHLGLNAQFISDLDVLTRGRFRNWISEDKDCQQSIASSGIAPNLDDAITRLVRKLDTLAEMIMASPSPDLEEIRSSIILVKSDTHAKRYRTLVAALNRGSILKTQLSLGSGEIEFIESLTTKILEGCAAAGVHLFPRGALENHLSNYKGPIYSISNDSKGKQVEIERDWILGGKSAEEVENQYHDVVKILDISSASPTIDVRLFLGYTISELIGSIQRGVERGEITSEDALKNLSSVDWPSYERIVELISYEQQGRAFKCTMRLREPVDSKKSEFKFTDETAHAKFSFNS